VYCHLVIKSATLAACVKILPIYRILFLRFGHKRNITRLGYVN